MDNILEPGGPPSAALSAPPQPTTDFSTINNGTNDALNQFHGFADSRSGRENVTEQEGIGAGISCRLLACGERKNELRPSWRGLMISVLAAAILSVAATLLLGGAGNLTGGAAPGLCGGAACRPAGGAGPGVRAPRGGIDGAFPAAGVSTGERSAR